MMLTCLVFFCRAVRTDVFHPWFWELVSSLFLVIVAVNTLSCINWVCCIFVFIQLTIFSNIPCDLYFDFWIILKYLYFPNIAESQKFFFVNFKLNSFVARGHNSVEKQIILRVFILVYKLRFLWTCSKNEIIILFLNVNVYVQSPYNFWWIVLGIS